MNEIQRIRKKTGLSQSKFAKHFNIPVRTIQKWEIQQATPPYYLIEMMKQILSFEQAEVIKRDTKIPDYLRNYFWDCKVEELDLEKNSDYIISRLYNYGGVKGRTWVRMHYVDKTIIKSACCRRDLDPIVANYLRKEFKINKADMAYYKESNDWR